jgi:hypothetical protein
MSCDSPIVIPANPGIDLSSGSAAGPRMPAVAGMTVPGLKNRDLGL